MTLSPNAEATEQDETYYRGVNVEANDTKTLPENVKDVKNLLFDRYKNRYLITQLRLVNFNCSDRPGVTKEEAVCTKFHFVPIRKTIT